MLRNSHHWSRSAVLSRSTSLTLKRGYREDLVVGVTRQKVHGLVESPPAATFETSVNPSTENHLMSLTCFI